MATKPKKQARPEPTFEPVKSYPFYVDPNDRDKTARSGARLASLSTVAATRVIVAAEGKSGLSERLDIPALIKLMREQATAVQGGDLAEAEAMLINQATALQGIFVRLIERGMAQDQLPQYEAHMRLALRAQSQCRATVEALASIKNPPVIYAKQANISHGHQQVNNKVQAGNLPAHGNNSIQSNELSGASNELLPDTRASQVESRINPPVEALAAIDRAAN